MQDRLGLGSVASGVRLAHATLLLTVLGGACEGRIVPESIVADRVFVIDREPGAEMTVEPDRLLFPADSNQFLLERQPGDILVSAREGGFLRRVREVSLDGESILIATEPAELTDALLQGDIVHSTATDDKADWLGGGLSAFASFGNLRFEGYNVRFHVLQGQLRFDPDLDVALRIRNARISQFALVASGQLDADFEFEIETDGEVSYSGYDWLLWTSPPKTFVQMVGSLPVVEVVTLRIGVNFSIAATGSTDVRMGASAHAQVAAGARYDTGSWERIGDTQLSFIQTVSSDLSVNSVDFVASGYVEIQVDFYEAAGPFAGFYPYFGKGTSGLYYGAEGVIGARTDWPFSNFGIDYTFLDFACGFDQTIADCIRNPPTHFSPIPRGRTRH